MGAVTSAIVGGLASVGGVAAGAGGLATAGGALVGAGKIAGAAHSLYSLAGSKKSAQASQQAIDRAQGAAGTQEAMAKDQFKWFIENIRPVQQQAIAQATSGALPALYADRGAADVTKAYDSALGSQQRHAARVGVDPSSPRYMQIVQNMNLARAAAEAGVRTAGRRDADAMNWNRRVQAAQFGQAIPGQSQKGLMSAANFNKDLSAAYDKDTASQAQWAGTALSSLGGIANKFTGGFADSYQQSTSPASAEADYWASGGK